MKDLLIEAFDFHLEVNNLIADYFEEHEGKISEKALDWFSHTINAQYLWNCRILKEERMYKFETHPLEICRQINQESFETTNQIINSVDLNDPVIWGNPKKQQFQNSVWQILFQVSNHYFHHRGQIMSDLRTNGIEPMWVDYIALRRSVLPKEA